jgi:DNA-binding MarR family transcriptional regulator
MSPKPPTLMTDKLVDWAPSSAAQMIIFWRILHLYMARYGSVPMGQLLVGMSTIVLNEIGHSPTVTDLCEATGLPKSSISRYISAQMAAGLVTEVIDPGDRRRRKLVQTEAGKTERKWQIKQIRKILEDVNAWDVRVAAAGGEIDADAELKKMKKIAGEDAPEEFSHRRKRGRPPAAA